jgi:hypothetical protein
MPSPKLTAAIKEFEGLKYDVTKVLADELESEEIKPSNDIQEEDDESAIDIDEMMADLEQPLNLESNQ